MGVKGGYVKHPKDQLCGNRYKPIQVKEVKYLDRIDDISRFGSNKEVFEKWVDVSTKQQSAETVRKILLSSKPYDICISFLCHYQTFDEDFLEEMYWITNNIFKNNRYDKNLLRTLIEFTDDYITTDERCSALEDIKDGGRLTPTEQKYLILRVYRFDGETSLIDQLLNIYLEGSRDRLDWSELNKWNLSERFRVKFSKEFEKAKFIADAYTDDDSYLPSSISNLS